MFGHHDHVLSGSISFATDSPLALPIGEHHEAHIRRKEQCDRAGSSSYEPMSILQAGRSMRFAVNAYKEVNELQYTRTVTEYEK